MCSSPLIADDSIAERGTRHQRAVWIAYAQNGSGLDVRVCALRIGNRAALSALQFRNPQFAIRNKKVVHHTMARRSREPGMRIWSRYLATVRRLILTPCLASRLAISSSVIGW